MVTFQVVAVSGSPITITTATAAIDAWLLDDCHGGTETLLVADAEVDLLAAAAIQPETIPAGEWCGSGVQFAAGDGLHLEGSTAAGTQFVHRLDPGLVVLAVEYEVDGDEWVLVLDGDLLLDPGRARSPRSGCVDRGPRSVSPTTSSPACQRRCGLARCGRPRRGVHRSLAVSGRGVPGGVRDIEIAGATTTGGAGRDLDGDGLVGAGGRRPPTATACPNTGDPDQDGDGVDDSVGPDGGSGGDLATAGAEATPGAGRQRRMAMAAPVAGARWLRRRRREQRVRR